MGGREGIQFVSEVLNCFGAKILMIMHVSDGSL